MYKSEYGCVCFLQYKRQTLFTKSILCFPERRNQGKTHSLTHSLTPLLKSALAAKGTASDDTKSGRKDSGCLITGMGRIGLRLLFLVRILTCTAIFSVAQLRSQDCTWHPAFPSMDMYSPGCSSAQRALGRGSLLEAGYSKGQYDQIVLLSWGKGAFLVFY